ncbi:MAG: acyl--CoA ligase [Nitrosomonas sp.]|nr:acyl--CoA ligase [Nitrosomonas sp.]
MNINQLLQTLGNTNKTIISDNHSTLTGKALADRVQEIAIRLNALGIKDKRICLLRMTNTVDAVVILLAALLNRAVVFIANPHDPVGKICATLDQFPVFALLTDRATSITVQKKTAGHFFSQVQAVDDAHFYVTLLDGRNKPISYYDHCMAEADIAIFSSGSTGEPKAILHQLDHVLLNAQLHAESIGLQGNDKIGITLPLYYSYGLVANLFSGLLIQCEINFGYQVGSIDAEWIDHNAISVLSITPFIAKKIDQPHPSLRVLTIGGDILHCKQAQRLLDLYPDCEIYSTYGLTEAGPRVSTCRIDASVLQNSFILPLGKPLTGVTLLIENDEKQGELWIHTPTHMLGYYLGVNDGFLPQYPDGALIRTGDLYEERRGHFYFIGRKKKIIFQGGEKIFPLMVETVLHHLEGVFDVMVASISDEEKGQVAKAFIVADESLTLHDVRKHLKQQLCGSLIPERLEFVSAIPRSQTGKILA